MKDKLKTLVVSFKDNAVNVGIGFGVILVLTGALAFVKMYYEFPGYEFVKGTIDFGVVFLGLHHIGKFVVGKVK